ncbi:MAG: L,D-transpeptidase [Candidatus Sulfotelmatobacter sp.]
MSGIGQTLSRAGLSRILAIALLAEMPALAQTENSGAEPSSRVAVVSLVDRKLAVMENGRVIAVFHVAVGATASPSATGEFRIVNRVSNPTYYHPGTVIPSGKDNPVGTRWLGLSQKGYGIHGTNAPRSIGRAASHGCIRLRNRDVERLFTMLRIGDVVQIHGERDPQVAQIFGGVPENTMIAGAQIAAQAGGQ